MSLPPPSQRQAQLIWLALTGLAIAVLVALVAGLVWGLGQVLRILSPVLWPVAVAGVLAYLLDPVVDRLERKGVSRVRAIVCVFALAVALVAALFSSVVPQLIDEARQLVATAPTYALNIEKRVHHWISHPPALLSKLLPRRSTAVAPPASSTVANEPVAAASTNSAGSAYASATNSPPIFGDALGANGLQKATSWLAGVLPKVGYWMFGQVGRVASWFGMIAGLALVPVYAFYFLLEKRSISSHWTDYLPVTDSRFKEELVFVLSSINGYLIAFFRGQVLVAICDGILYTIGFLVIGLPYAVLVGVMAIALTMIPFLGAIITCSTALVIALVQFGDWLHPLLVLGVFGFVQALEGLVISPKIMGGRVGLHPVTIIIAVMAGTTLLGGLLGGILAIPLTAALRVLMFRYVWKDAERAG